MDFNITASTVKTSFLQNIISLIAIITADVQNSILVDLTTLPLTSLILTLFILC